MNRRAMLTGLAASAAALTRAHATPLMPDAWDQWARTFLTPEGRVVDTATSISHSEGQGYALLLAQAFGDRARFFAIEAWSAHHLAIRQDPLMAWRWEQTPGANITDWHNATDGDLFRAWALLRAADAWGLPHLLEPARRIATAIATQCLAPDPQHPDQWLVLPGAEFPQPADGTIINPSYTMPRALWALGDAFRLPRLSAAATHGVRVLEELATTGHMPDWALRTPQGFAPAPGLSHAMGYDAIRVPLYLVWSGLAAHPAVGLAARRLSTPGGDLAIKTAPDGTVLERNAGYTSVLRAAQNRPVDLDNTAGLGQLYYPHTLHLLAAVATREGRSP